MSKTGKITFYLFPKPGEPYRKTKKSFPYGLFYGLIAENIKDTLSNMTYLIGIFLAKD